MPKDLEDKEDQLSSIEEKDANLEKDAAPEENIPDYDVKELEDAKEDGTEDDERLSKSRDVSDRTEERKQLTNREKRQLRKKRISEKFDAKDALIHQQQEQINTLAGRLNEVDGKLSHYDQSQLQQNYNESVAAFKAAEDKHAEAFSTGDGAKATAAMREMYAAQKRIDDLEAINARQQNTRRQPIQPNQADPIVVSKATAWAEKNDWFKPGGANDDSAIADTIAAKLVKEGFDPKSDDYWEELDDRLESKGIGEREENNPPPTPRKKSPPMGGGNGRGDMGSGKVAISLPTAYINALKENGKWDDPTVRNRMIKRYVDGVKSREAQG